MFLPHIRHVALTIQRWRMGGGGSIFFEQHHSYAGGWLQKNTFPTGKHRKCSYIPRALRLPRACASSALLCMATSAFTTATPITSFPPNAHTSKAHPTELLLGAFAYVCLVTCVSKSLRSVSPTTTTPSSLFCFAAGTCPASTFRSEDLPLRKQQCGDGGGGKDTKKIPNSGQRR